MHQSAPASAFDALHPLVASWCKTHLIATTSAQEAGVPAGAERKNLLISSPTGTGKTLAAFLPIFSRLARRRDEDCLFPRTYALYVSPLRALGYDVEHKVRRPLREMELLERPNSPRAVLRRGRIREQFVRTGVRTVDTPVDERRLMLRRLLDGCERWIIGHLHPSLPLEGRESVPVSAWMYEARISLAHCDRSVLPRMATSRLPRSKASAATASARFPLSALQCGTD